MLYPEFARACEAQGATLHPDLVKESWGNFNITWIMRRLLLAGEPLATGLVEPSFCDGPISSYMVGLINTSQQPDTEFRPRFAMVKKEAVGACQSAEKFFGMWLQGLEAGEGVGGRILVDGKGQALAIQKAIKHNTRAFGEPSTLLLQGVAVGEGLRLAPGSLVYMDVRPSVLREETPSVTRVVRGRDVKGMYLLRLSGFALSDTEWQEYIGEWPIRTEYMHLDRAEKVAQTFLRQSRPWWHKIWGSSQRPTDMVSSNQS